MAEKVKTVKEAFSEYFDAAGNNPIVVIINPSMVGVKELSGLDLSRTKVITSYDVEFFEMY